MSLLGLALIGWAVTLFLAGLAGYKEGVNRGNNSQVRKL